MVAIAIVMVTFTIVWANMVDAMVNIGVAMIGIMVFFSLLWSLCGLSLLW